MIKSQYILDILDLTFDDHKASELLRKQVDYLTVSDTEHTGIGLFINFSADPGVQYYKIKKELLLNDTDNPATLEMVNGLEIIKESQNILADATVHLENGIINCLEIWNKGGGDYPLTEPEHYALNQTWRDEQDKRKLKR
jgi:hypothetical protein